MSISIYIILITCIVSAICLNNHEWFLKLEFTPFRVQKYNEQYRFITHGLVHADWMHLLFNMFALYFFGPVVQYYMQFNFGDKGILYFILMYVGALAVASLPTFAKQKNNAHYHSVGASGAISAVVFSSIIFNPMNKICLYGVLCFPGILWGIIYLVYSYYQGKKNEGFINHDAHFAGAVFGILFTIATKPTLVIDFFEQLYLYFQ